MKRIFFLCILLIISSQFVIAQHVITGNIHDAKSGQPLAGAYILVPKAKKATTTDYAGQFKLSLESDSSHLLEISYIGYHSQTLEVKPGGPMLQIELSPNTAELGTVVVTATRGRRGAYEVPLRIGIMQREAIEAMPVFSADDILRSIPGISVSRGASFFGSSTVSMRGMGSEAGRTLVMVDGVPVNKSDGGSVNWNAISFNDIEQVEVIKGSGSSIYGGNAMGGVINLISQTPQKRLEGTLSQSIGTFNTYQTQLKVSGRGNKFYWGLQGMYRNSDGYITTPADEVDEYSIASFLDEYQIGGRLGYTLTARQSFEINGGYYNGKRGTGAKYSGYGFENDELAADNGAYNQYTNTNLRLIYRASFQNNSSLNMTLYGQQEIYANIRESFRNNAITRYDVESGRDDMGLNSSYSFNLGTNHLITSGLDFRYGAVDGADMYLTSSDEVLNKGKMNQLGIYAQDEVSFGQSPFSLLAGVRFDIASFYDGAFIINNPTNETAFLQDFDGALADASFNAFSPRLSMQYFEKGKFRLYAGYSKGFRAAVLDDLCRTGRISGGMKLANPELKPEYLDNFELGADFFVGPSLRISPTAFYAIGRDYHAYIATGDSLLLNNRMRPIRIKDNIGEVNIQGVELEMELKISDNFQWRLAYSHTKTEIKQFDLFDAEKDDDLVGKALVYQPTDGLFSSFAWQSNVLNGLATINYKGAQWLNDVNTEKIDAFLYVDMRLWRQVYKGLTAAVNVHNLFNQEYIDSRNIIAPGRMVMAELKYSF
jgi:outer membrane receptor protein involved in Fe transport